MYSKNGLFILFLMLTASLAEGQSILGLNAGYINPFPILNYDSYTSGSTDYAGSFFVSTTYRKNAGKKLFLGTSLYFHHYQLDYYEKNAIHPGLDEFTKDIRYKFNNLSLVFYPEFVFGHRLKYYINAGISVGLLLNAHKSGTNTHMRTEEGSNGEHHPVYTVTLVEGDARSDMKNFSVGVQIGTGLRYNLSDRWDINLDVSGRFIPFPVETYYAGSQVDLLISVGGAYTFPKKKEKKTKP